MLTEDQKRRRYALVEAFRAKIVAAMWEQIGEADGDLLCSDDGTPYGEMRQHSTGVTSLEQMVNESASKAVVHLRCWL